jgi:hypothetical protein
MTTILASYFLRVVARKISENHQSHCQSYSKMQIDQRNLISATDSVSVYEDYSRAVNANPARSENEAAFTILRGELYCPAGRVNTGAVPAGVGACIRKRVIITARARLLSISMFSM